MAPVVLLGAPSLICLVARRQDSLDLFSSVLLVVLGHF